MAARRLAPGEGAGGIPVHARLRWNATGILVSPHEHYRLTADGEWTDWFVATSANGYTKVYLRPAEPFRRLPDEPWFCLCGAVTVSGEPFAIGRTLEWVVPESADGELLCFSNDVPWAYWNNRGAVVLAVQRIR